MSIEFRDRHRAVGAILTREEHARLTELANREGRKVGRHAAEILRDYLREKAPSITPEQ